MTLLVGYLASRRVFVPDHIQNGLAQIIAEGINSALPLLSMWISGVITKVAAELSKDKAVQKAQGLARVIEAQNTPQSTNIGKLEMKETE